jgi:hypothetical protein
MKGKLNLDIPKSVAEFEALINKVLPKRIFYKLLLRGKGLEFDSYRNFGQDEDASLIDWKASVRSKSLLAKQYIQERDIKVMIVVDVGENMVFGSQQKLKCEYTAEVAAAFSHVIMGSGDKIGFILFSKDIVKINMPSSGKDQFNVFAYNLSDPDVYGGVSDIGVILPKIIERLSPSISLVVLISDFLKVKETQKKEFEKLGNIFETFAIMIRDPLDKTLPDINKEIIIENPENGERLVINPKISKKVYEMNVKKQTEVTKEILKKSNIDLLELDTRDNFAFPLASFLKRRVDRRD